MPPIELPAVVVMDVWLWLIPPDDTQNGAFSTPFY
jgi:hypothetical protein